MKIEYPDNFSLDDLNNNFLWKYLSLIKLIDLINSKSLYFARFDSFEDGLEGLTGKGIGLKFFSLGEPSDESKYNTNFDEKTKENLIKRYKNNSQEYLEILSNSQQTQFASCWFFGTKESLAMWKIYSQRDGVAVKFNARQLTDAVIASAESFTNSDYKFLYFGPVDYKNIWPFDPEERFEKRFNGLKKDISYSHENEFRFVVAVPKVKKGEFKNFILPIGVLSSYEMEIITNPYMEHWEIENIRNLLKLYELDSFLKPSKMEIRK